MGARGWVAGEVGGRAISVAKQRNYHRGGIQLPLITPLTDWEPPTELPDLRGKVKEIAEDTETRDLGLQTEMGPGWPWKGGYICGLSWAWGTEPGEAIYVPLNHPETQCLDRDNVRRWMQDHRDAGIHFLYQSSPYDVGWTQSDLGVTPPTQIEDVMAMATMIDESRPAYDLDSLCRWRGLPGKDEKLLREACTAFGYSSNKHTDENYWKANLWRLPARFVGPYGVQDVAALLPLAASLRADIAKQGLEAAYRLEMDLVPMTVEMRRRGIKFNTERAEKLRESFLLRRDAVVDQISSKLCHTVDMDMVRSAKHVEQWLTAEGVPFTRTAGRTDVKTGRHVEGQTSLESEWLRSHQHWLPRLIGEARQLTESAEKHIKQYLLDHAHKGRLYAVINQFRTDDGGTRSHRFSYSNPPLQQVPSRGERGPAKDWPLTKEIAVAIRSCFEPESGEIWSTPDQSQQEFRMIVHFACAMGLARAEEAGDRYRDDPDADFHIMVSEMTGLDRDPAKDTNFAKAFGAGIPKFASMIGKSIAEAKSTYEQYDDNVPFVKELSRECDALAQQRGWIKLIDGARLHFDKWEAARREANYNADGKWLGARDLEEARKLWPEERLRRAFCHKAMNGLIQGSAARQTKKWMRLCWQEKIVPLLQMHDALELSSPDEKTALRVQELGREAVKLRVPVRVDLKFGRTWGTAKKKTWAEALAEEPPK